MRLETDLYDKGRSAIREDLRQVFSADPEFCACTSEALGFDTTLNPVMLKDGFAQEQIWCDKSRIVVPLYETITNEQVEDCLKLCCNLSDKSISRYDLIWERINCQDSIKSDDLYIVVGRNNPTTLKKFTYLDIDGIYLLPGKTQFFGVYIFSYYGFGILCSPDEVKKLIL